MIGIFSIAAFLFCLFIPKIDLAHPADLSEALEKHYRLEKPDGNGPFPAVMMVSGGSGFNASFAEGHYDAVQRELVNLGFVTLRVDYLGARNAASLMEVSVEQVATDIAVSAEYLREKAFVKKGAINIIGWSYGGASALQALGRTYNRKAVEVDAVVAYYPACNLVQQKWESEVPVLVLVGTADNIAPVRHCEFLFRGLPGHRFTLKVYDDAHHCFDMIGLPPERQYEWGTIGYKETAAKSAWLEVTKFLKK